MSVEVTEIAKDNLWFLVAAYTSIWVVLAWLIAVLLRRNRRLSRQLDELTTRIEEMEREQPDDRTGLGK